MARLIDANARGFSRSRRGRAEGKGVYEMKILSKSDQSEISVALEQLYRLAKTDRETGRFIMGIDAICTIGVACGIREDSVICLSDDKDVYKRQEHYPNGELSGGFSRDRIRPAEYVDEGRYRYTLACSQNKKGIAAKRALWAEFFDETFHRKDMDADAEKQKILRDIEQGKAAAHKDAAATDKETNTMLIYSCLLYTSRCV